MSRLRYLVVVVPGIGGSVLTDSDGRSAWDLTAGRLGGAVIDPQRLEIGRDLTPTRLVDSLVVLRPWLVVPGYEMLTHHLQRQFGKLRVADHNGPGSLPPDLDVLRVPYDFRRSITHAADALGRAVTEAVETSGRKVIVVAHSMGGLVARYWLGPAGGARHCRALLTLGTPHRGAPRALDWLFNGAGIGPLSSGKATRILRGWESVYELLPQYPAVWTSGVAVEPTELPAEAVRTFGDANAPADVLRRTGAAASVHADITSAWAGLARNGQRSQLPYFGRGHKTLNRLDLCDGRVRASKDDPPWRDNVGWRGDGTVPALSAIPPEFSTTPELAQALPDKHGPMGSTAVIVEKIVTMQGDDLPVRGDGRPARPWIGWDIDEVAAAGEPIDIGVELLDGAHLHADLAAGPAYITISGIGLPVPMRPDEDRCWSATLDPLPIGTYTVHVEVKNAWYGSAVAAESPLAVLSPDTR